MSKELNDIRKLAGLKPLMESKAVNESAQSIYGAVIVDGKKYQDDEIATLVGTDVGPRISQGAAYRGKKGWSWDGDQGEEASDIAITDGKKVTQSFGNDNGGLPAALAFISGEVSEEVDHTRYGNESHPQSYELGAFDNKGRASLKNRYVQARYGDNPLKNARQIAKEDEITLESLEVEFQAFLAEGTTEECDDTDEDILVKAKDQLDEINLDEMDSESKSGQAYYEAVAAEMGRRLQAEVNVVSYHDMAQGRGITFEISRDGAFIECDLSHGWARDGSPTKPVTSMEIDSRNDDGGTIVRYGRLAIWPDNPASYGEDLLSHDDVDRQIDDALDAQLNQGEQLGEDEETDSNFTSDDIKQLGRIRDINAAKQKAVELITRKSTRSMKPNKIAFFKNAIAAKKSVADVIKLMYDLLLSGEGFGVVGSTGSMKPNSYRKQFGEADGAQTFTVIVDDCWTSDNDYAYTHVWYLKEITADSPEQAKELIEEEINDLTQGDLEYTEGWEVYRDYQSDDGSEGLSVEGVYLNNQKVL